MVGGGLTAPYAEIEAAPPGDGRREIAFACLDCEAPLTVTVSVEQAPHDRTVICVACGSAYRVNLVSETVTLTGKYERDTGEIVRRTGSQPWTPCPVCHRHLRCALRNDRAFFAFCKDDKRIVSVSLASFEQYKMTHSSS
jgi:hypothetical protein